MTDVPVESMRDQGLFWFVDLTVADPYFLLPVMTASSVFIHLKMGADGVNIDNMPKGMQKFILAMPIITLPFMCMFPTALNVYWFTTNIISITQARIVKRKPVREFFGIPEIKVHKPGDLADVKDIFGMMKKSAGKVNEKLDELEEKHKIVAEENARPIDMAQGGLNSQNFSKKSL
jgi:membrane protein insertase Oxa1/YidC/SpoIIIJ